MLLLRWRSPLLACPAHHAKRIRMCVEYQCIACVLILHAVVACGCGRRRSPFVSLFFLCRPNGLFCFLFFSVSPFISSFEARRCPSVCLSVSVVRIGSERQHSTAQHSTAQWSSDRRSDLDDAQQVSETTRGCSPQPAAHAVCPSTPSVSHLPSPSARPCAAISHCHMQPPVDVPR